MSPWKLGIWLPVAAVLIGRFLLDFNGLYGQDAHYYLHYAQNYTEHFTQGLPLGDYLWPVTYPFIASWFGTLFGNHDFFLQLLSAVGIVLAAWSIKRLLLLWHPAVKLTLIDAFTVISVAASPFLLRSGVLVMSDALALGFGSASIYGCMHYVARNNALALVGAGLSAGLAVTTRYPMVLILLPPLLYAGFTALRTKSVLHLGILFGAGALALLPEWIWHWEGVMAAPGHDALTTWSPSHFFQRNFLTSEGNLSYSLPNILYGLHPFLHIGFCLLFLPLLLFVKWKKWKGNKAQTLIISVVVYLIFVVGIPTQNMRFLLPVAPLVAILLFPAFVRGFEWVKRYVGKAQWLLWMAFVGQVVLFPYVLRTQFGAQQVEKQMAVATVKESKNTIYTFGMELALETYNTPHHVQSLYDSLSRTPVPGELLLYNPDVFSTQWEGQVVMTNYQYIRNRFELEVLHQHQGWTLARLREKR